MRRFLNFVLGSILVLGVVQSAWATMIVNTSIVIFEPGKPNRQDVEIYNPDKEPLYVQVEVLQVMNPGSENEQRKRVFNPKESGFLVTPNKLVIAPGARKTVRLVNLQPLGDRERIFRVNLKPVVGEVEAEQTGIKIIVGYQLLVMMQPQQPDLLVLSERKGKSLVLKNVGNTNVMYRLGKQCLDENKESTCTEISGKRLYPGQTWKLDLPLDQAVEFMTQVGSENKAVAYP